MKTLSILLALIFVQFSCSKKRKLDNIVDLTSISEPNITNLSELGSDIIYIPLETNASCLIKQIDKLIYESGSYFLGSINDLNRLPDGLSPFFLPTKNDLYQFSKKGEFISQIGRQGEAPSEYRIIKDFLYNESNNTIEIFSLKEIKEFSLDGIWRKNKTIEYDRVASVGHTNNQLLGFIDNTTGQNEYSFVLFDANGKVINKFENKYKFTTANGTIYPTECIFYRYDGILHCKELHSDTIFSFNNGTFIPKHILKQGEAKFTSDLRGDKQFYNFIIQKNAFESKNYLFLQYDLKKRDNCFINNKSNETQYLINNGIGLVNDLDNGPNFKIQNIFTLDGIEYLISWINAFELKAHVGSEAFKNPTPKYLEKKKKLEKLANSLEENDNPVLMLVKLKE